VSRSRSCVAIVCVCLCAVAPAAAASTWSPPSPLAPGDDYRALSLVARHRRVLAAVVTLGYRPAASIAAFETNNGGRCWTVLTLAGARNGCDVASATLAQGTCTRRSTRTSTRIGSVPA
jgi:hypothetical protein